MARISTHVLDTFRGNPAAGIEIRLYVYEAGECRLVCRAKTNADGRTDQPLLAGDDIALGTYEIVFRVSEYLRESGAALTDPAFLEEVPVRFGVGDPHGNYHIPLLLSAYGYTTYRGS